MSDKVNIIIPAIIINQELKKCLKGISKLNYKKFIATIVLDENNK